MMKTIDPSFAHFDVYFFVCLLSYGVGLLGSFAYMRMLGNSVDSMADGARGLVKYVLPFRKCKSIY